MIDRKLLMVRQCERKELERMRDVAEFLWIVVANVSERNWDKQNKDWQEAAGRARDDFHQLCKELQLRSV